MTTSAPTSANATAMAAPSPRPPPVTTATLSSSRNLSRITGVTVARRESTRNPISETRSSCLPDQTAVVGAPCYDRTYVRYTAVVDHGRVGCTARTGVRSSENRSADNGAASRQLRGRPAVAPQLLRTVHFQGQQRGSPAGDGMTAARPGAAK